MNTLIKYSLIISLMIFNVGCTTLEGPENPDDPFESFNRSMYSFNEKLDEYVMKPVAEGYQAITPDAVDTGVTNFFGNLGDVLTLINDLLQLKIDDAIATSARIAFNSTIGLFGIMDVATDFGLPKHEEDFGQTLGAWGVESGPYLVLPFFGPSNIRDTAGFVADNTELDYIYDDMSQSDAYSLLALKYIDKRADLLKAKDIVDETAPDPYAFIRDAWMQRRKNKVYDGNPPEEDEDDLFEEDLFTDDIVR
ncbi:MAG: VacJ family lipoprotein [Gammaproteobacteria bacterium]|nr:VacJ family lipoprotein [Gammaproteobacteria bacterium]MCW8924615.1 VacJ family lipoprotein [Gammaproteobacteria bacterium]